MDSMLECQKLCMETEDRISSLPDLVLSNILSFLPTKYAVATSILCKRWKPIWASVPVLDFDDSLLLLPQHGNTERKFRLKCFMNFVDRVLILCNASYIRKFRLKCRNCDTFRVNTWILAVLRGGLQEIDLCITLNQSFKLTPDLFAFQQLVSLKLGKKFVLHVPMSVCFPSLKILHLESIEFLDDDSTHKLFSSCPVLEELMVENCGLKNIRIFSVSAPALKSLMILCSNDAKDDYNTEFCEYEIVIDAPALECFLLSDFVAISYSLKNLQCPLEVSIDVFLGRREKGDIGKCGLELLKGISNSKYLVLPSNSLEVFSFLNGRNLPMFQNLIRLEVEVSKYCGQLLPILLENSPNLKILSLELEERVEEFKWKPRRHVPVCLLLHLNEVVIFGFSGQENVIEFIKYLLENAKFLNKVSAPATSDVEDVAPAMSDLEDLKIGKNLLRHLLVRKSSLGASALFVFSWFLIF